MIQPRIKNPHAAAPEAIEAMTALEMSLARCGLDHNLLELVKLRVSQMNGCCCGPLMTGPVMGWLMRVSVAVRLPLGPVAVAVTSFGPSRKPRTTPSAVDP